MRYAQQRNLTRLATHLLAALVAVVALLAAINPASAALSPITIFASGCFSGMTPRGLYPISMEITNVGPPVQGAIRVKEDTFDQSAHVYNYPIDLPTGTTKRVIAYPALSQYGSAIDVDLIGAGHNIGTNVAIKSNGESENPQTSFQIGLIGDDDGGMSAIRTSAPASGQQPTSSNALSFQDCYCKPEDAPDRGAGYNGLSALVIGAGSERLSGDQWDAIRQYALGGGSVVLIGGPGSLAYLNTPGALRISPVENFQQTEVPSLSFAGAQFGPAGLIVGSLKQGAVEQASQGTIPLITHWRYGTGLVSLIAFDPLERSIRVSPASKKLWMEIGKLAHPDSEAPDAQSWSLQQLQALRDMDQESASSGKTADVNPFRITLPPISTVAAIFLVYFIMVVPLTYFVLRKMGRLEWAWVSSPLISIGFAFVFYVFTMSLYQAGLSRRTAGVISAVEGDPDARLSAVTEIFFPRGGSYQIAVPGAEEIEERSDQSEEGYYATGRLGSSSQSSLTTYDSAEGVVAPEYEVTNLSFRRFYHSEPVSLGGPILAKLSASAGGNVTGTVTNLSSLPLSNVIIRVFADGAEFDIARIASGQTVTLAGQTAIMGRSTASDRSPLSSLCANDSGLTNSATLVANVPAENFGPNVGRDLTGATGMALVVSIPVAGRATNLHTSN